MQVGSDASEQGQAHEEEAHHLDLDSAYAVDEVDSGPIARDGRGHGDEGLEFGDGKGVVVGIDFVFMVEKMVINEGLDEVGAVEDDVDKEPWGGAGEEVAAMAAEEFSGE